MTVSVKKNNNIFPLSTLEIALLSLLLHQKHKRIVEGSERIVNIWVLLFEADGERSFWNIESIN